MYWSISGPKLRTFALHVPTPADEKDEIYPTAVANSKGEVLFVWQVGPMSTEGTATVKWALYRTDGRFTGRQGELGTSFSGTKATAFTCRDDAFCIVTTARPTPAVAVRDGRDGKERTHIMELRETVQWSPLAPFAGAGSIGSPGGTHPVVADGNTVHAVYAQGGRIYYRRSADAAVTWSDAVQLVTSGSAQYPCSWRTLGPAGD